MRNLKSQIKDISHVAKIIIKYGTIFSIILIMLAFFSAKYSIDMCTVSVYIFSESIIAGLIFDVIEKRKR